MPGLLVLRPFLLGGRRPGGVAIRLAMAWMIQTNRFSCYEKQWVRAPRCGVWKYHDLCDTPSIKNLGLEHFYAAFGLSSSRNLRNSAAVAIDIDVSSISETLFFFCFFFFAPRC